MKTPGTEPDQTDLAIKAIEEALEPLKEMIESANLGLTVMISPLGNDSGYCTSLTNMPPKEVLMSSMGLVQDMIQDNPELLYPACEILIGLLSKLTLSMDAPPNVGPKH